MARAQSARLSSFVVPEVTRSEIAVLKGMAAHYVMRAQDRIDLMERQRSLLAELFEVLSRRGEVVLDATFRSDFVAAGDDAARVRVVVDQIASLTDGSAVAWHERLCRQ